MIKLKILAEDIQTTSYMDAPNCAITRALARAGYSQYRHVGDQIRDNAEKWLDQEILCTDKNSNLGELNERVLRMYNYLEEPDFEFTLIIETE